MTGEIKKLQSDDNMSGLRDRLLVSPGDAVAMSDLACLLESSGDITGAIDLYQRALRVDPYQIDVIVRLGQAWGALGDLSRARSWFARALAIDPDCGEAAAALATSENATGGKEAYALTPAYIRTLFDQYADRFDQELTGTLAYRAPVLVAAALDRAGLGDARIGDAGLGDGGVDILDLGCGTGLSGKALRRFARRLDGVDLSPGMIARARTLALYDTLSVGDALDYLRRADRRWRVVAAVDMLNYLGDLAPLFRVAAMRLDAGGLLVGTVEMAEGGGAVLTAKRRYAHDAAHLRGALASAGLVPCDLSEDTLRTEAGAPVRGLIFMARAAA